MVTVRKSNARFFPVQNHFLVMATIFGLIAAGGIFVLLKSSEDKMRVSSGPTSVRGGVAQAHSSKSMAQKAHLVYGTAWKKENTAKFVSEAIQSGFRFIDTACQPKHYNEPQVGDGIRAAMQELGLARDDLWIQTKYTSYSGQDPNNVPYDPQAPLEEQVRTSLEVSLKNLRTDYLDSWVLHSPMEVFEDTMRVWRVMEEAVDAGKVVQLGISNCYDLHVFKTLYHQANHKPAVLQNRFYADSNFDTKLRQFCRARNIQYQSFWTLTANRHALAKPEVKEAARAKRLTPQTYLYAFLMSLHDGYITPLDGTTDRVHMAEDVAVMERIQGGETLFTEMEQMEFAKILGMPGQ